MNEQHIWSHRSRHHQPSAAETDEWNHHRRLKINIFTIGQHETTAATVQDKEALCKWIYLTRAQEKTEVLLIREGILMGVFNSALMWTNYANRIHYIQGSQECSCDICSDINYDKVGDSVWWKQIKDLYTRLRGSSCYSNKVIHQKDTSVWDTQTDALRSWC